MHFEHLSLGFLPGYVLWGWKMFLCSLYAYFVEIIGLGSLTMQGYFNYYQEGLLILFNYIKLQQLAVKDIYDVNIRLVAFCCQ